MGRPFIRQLPRKEGDRFYGCRFCSTQIASAPTISVAENDTISRETIPDFVNVYTPNRPMKWGHLTFQELYCTHCNGRLGWKSIRVQRKQSGADLTYCGAMRLQEGIPSPAELSPATEMIDDEESQDGTAENDDYIFENDNIPVPSNNLYVCWKCMNQIAYTVALLRANFSPPGSELSGGLFAYAFNEYLDIREMRRDVGHYTIQDIHCYGCSDHLGWRIVEDRRSPGRYVVLIDGYYLFKMDKLRILRLDDDDDDDDDPPHQNQGHGK